MKILEILTKNRKTGNKGEDAAVRYLKKKRYKILKRNYVAFDSEIDIIAENKTTVAFVEVKTRTVGRENPKESRPAAAVNPKKQRKIIAAAKCYLGSLKGNTKEVSLDIIEVYLNPDGTKNKIVHLEGAFNSNTAYNRN